MFYFLVFSTFLRSIQKVDFNFLNVFFSFTVFFVCLSW